MYEAPKMPDTSSLLYELAVRLDGLGLAPLRLHIDIRTLHPEVSVVLYVWRRNIGKSEVASSISIVEDEARTFAAGVVREISLPYGSFESAAYRASPFYRIDKGESYLHFQIEPSATVFEYEILKDLHADGATGYLALPIRFTNGIVSASSWATSKDGGYTEEDLRLLRDLVPPLSLLLEIHSQRNVTRTLLNTYLGRDTGESVLAGRVRRGDVERIEAAIWFSDMRGFTNISDALESEALIAWLNEYFGAISGPIERHGGEILKFIGDAVLAIFPVTSERSQAAVCAAAVAAASESNTELDNLNLDRATRGLPPLEQGIALHIGEVQYGNIGGERRLDFTVIGQAVNVASRIEGLCGKLGRRVLTSSALAEHIEDGLVSLGSFELKGITQPQELFGVVAASAT